MRRKLLKNKFWEQKYKTCLREEKPRHYCNVIFALLFIATTSFGVILNSVPSVAAGCNDVEFIFVRGSGESLNGPNYQAWRSSLEERLSHATLSYNFYELGSQKQMSYQYPLITITAPYFIKNKFAKTKCYSYFIIHNRNCARLFSKKMSRLAIIARSCYNKHYERTRNKGSCRKFRKQLAQKGLQASRQLYRA